MSCSCSRKAYGLFRETSTHNRRRTASTTATTTVSQNKPPFPSSSPICVCVCSRTNKWLIHKIDAVNHSHMSWVLGNVCFAYLPVWISSISSRVPRSSGSRPATFLFGSLLVRPGVHERINSQVIRFVHSTPCAACA